MERQNDISLWENLVDIDMITTSSREELWNKHDNDADIQVCIGTENSTEKNLSNVLLNTSFSPHGVITGMTGSGKSIAIRTIALTLAAKYSPERVQIVYAASKYMDPLIEELPHIIKTFNLDEHESCFNFTKFINGIIADRQKELQEAQEFVYRDIEKEPPNPSIIVLVDEPAAGETPRDVYPGIMNIMRKARQLDMHCVVASQNPKSIQASIYDNAGWTILLNSIVSQPYDDLLKNVQETTYKPLNSGEGYLIQQHYNIFPVHLFDTSCTNFKMKDYREKEIHIEDNNLVVGGNKKDNSKTLFLSIGNHNDYDKELCENYNLKHVIIGDNQQGKPISLDPFLFSQNKEFVSNIISSLIILSLLPQNEDINDILYPRNSVNTFREQISQQLRSYDISNSKELIFGNNMKNVPATQDKNACLFVKNKSKNNLLFNLIFNASNHHQSIDQIVQDYDGVLISFDETIHIPSGSPIENWTTRQYESALLVSFIFSCMKKYAEDTQSYFYTDNDYQYYDDILSLLQDIEKN